MRSVEYGSVFMYKNGFRIYPFGEVGKDLLQIDRRKQQGYARFLGTRDLIGRIEINDPENIDNLKETTSRDGGLIKNKNSEALTKVFYNKDFLDILIERDEENLPSNIKILSILAAKTNNPELLKKVRKLEKQFNKIKEAYEE